jgi:hypothetical protein
VYGYCSALMCDAGVTSTLRLSLEKRSSPLACARECVALFTQNRRDANHVIQ